MRPDAVDLIRTGRLWFSDPSRFNDPFDFVPGFQTMQTRARIHIDRLREAVRWQGGFSRLSRKDFLDATSTEYEKRLRKVRKKFLTEHSEFRSDFAKHFRVTCFSADNDNILMWSHYAAYHSGVCIGIHPAKMRLAPEKALRWKVSYNDKRLPIDHTKSNEIAFRKAKAWKYENEWRVVMAVEDLKSGQRPVEHVYKDRPPFDEGLFWKLQWDAIESVRFGVFVDRKKRARILKLLLEKKRSHIRAIQMHLSIGEFRLEEETLSP